jgi:hypothetical protein
MRTSNEVMGCAKVDVRHAFLAMRRPFFPGHRPFVAVRRSCSAVLHAFAATRSEREDAV